MLTATHRVALRARGAMRLWSGVCSMQRKSSPSDRNYHMLPCKTRLRVNTPTQISWRSIGLSTRLDNKVVAFTLSDPGEGIREVVVKQWFVKEGDRVSQFAPVVDVESDKATTTITSRYDGVIRKLHYAVEQTAIVGSALLDIEIEEKEGDNEKGKVAAAPESAAVPKEAPKDASEGRVPDGKVLATPAIRRLAAEQGVKLSEVRGSGKNGRIFREDIVAFVAQRSQPEKQAESRPQPAKSAPASPTTPAVSAAPSLTYSAASGGVKLTAHAQALLGSDRSEPLKGGVRKAMFKSMTQSLAVPAFTYMDEVEMSRLMQTVRRLRSQISSGPKLTPMAFLIKATSLALQAFPQLNASVTANEQLTYKAAHNIGVAIDSPSGLIVPNIKYCQLMSVPEIATEIQRLQSAAVQGRVSNADLVGGTVTLSNVGVVGGTYTVPIMMPGEILIAGIGRVRDQLALADDNDDVTHNRAGGRHGRAFVDAESGEPIRVRRASMMSVSWSADHRVVDGATVARFSNLWKSFLETPDSMLLGMK